MQNNDIKVFDGTMMPEKKLSLQNENLMQIKSKYAAAMMVPKPRNLENIVSAIMREAKEAKDDFYYSWLVNNKKTGKKEPIEGGTIGLAQSIARSWTNCAIETEVKEFGGEWIFKTTFVDFENGFTTEREFRMMIPQEGTGNYDYERTRNMRFQIGQSKNQRDCIFNAVPRWLKKQAIEAAKAASQKDAEIGTDNKLKKALESFDEKGISEQDLLGYFGKNSIKEFDLKTVAMLRNLWVQLDNGETSVEAIKEQAKDVFDRSRKENQEKQNDRKPNRGKTAKESNKKIQDVKKDPHSEMGTAPAKEAMQRADFERILKSFEMRYINRKEICYYFGIDDIEELNCEIGISDLRSVISEIESENMSPQEFKEEAAKRFKIKLERNKK